MLTDISHIYLTMPNAETIVIFGTSLGWLHLLHTWVKI